MGIWGPTLFCDLSPSDSICAYICSQWVFTVLNQRRYYVWRGCINRQNVMGGSKQALGTCIFALMSRGKTRNIQNSHCLYQKLVSSKSIPPIHPQPTSTSGTSDTDVPLFTTGRFIVTVCESIVCLFWTQTLLTAISVW